MSLIPSGKTREMRQQLVHPSYRVDLSALLKIAKPEQRIVKTAAPAMAPPGQAKPQIEQEQVDFGGDEGGGQPQPAAGAPSQPQPQAPKPNGMSIQQTNRPAGGMQPLDPATQQKQRMMEQKQKKQQQQSYLEDVKRGIEPLLLSAGVNPSVHENPEQGSVTYDITVKQYYTDTESGTVYDNLGVAKAIVNFANEKGASSIKYPMLPADRPAPTGLFNKAQEWKISLTFGGKKEAAEDEAAAHGVNTPSQHAKPVGRINKPGGGAANTDNHQLGAGEQQKAASIGLTMSELMSLQKEALVPQLCRINQGKANAEAINKKSESAQTMSEMINVRRDDLVEILARILESARGAR